MNKAELIDEVARRAGLSKSDARTAVDALFDPSDGVIARALRSGDRVGITGFGTFEVRHRRERTGRNPRTGEEMRVPAGRAPAFRAGKGLKEGTAG